MEMSPEEVHVMVCLSHAGDREVAAGEVATLLDLEPAESAEILASLAARDYIVELGEGYMLDAKGRQFLLEPRSGSKTTKA